ncbi:MAG TPA: SAM-dependent methyltransferase [Cytophagaceae bacterium]|jgi:16S rRNA (cytidine1402-2'-O)-methyltransferase|nr:SAM-dependent methyltransferase [Cytophagaceae bacterium]
MKLKRIYLLPNELHENTLMQTLSPSAVQKVKTLKVFFTESEKMARRCIAKTKPEHPIDTIDLHLVDKDTTTAQVESFFKTIEEEEAGILSDAGCPGIADPGAVVVALAHRKGIDVIPMVGPSSVLLALMASGMNGQSFYFHGYLPIEQAKRVKSIKQMVSDSMKTKTTQLFIETPYRNLSLWKDLLEQCSSDTLLCVACDITGPHQYIKTMSVSTWKKTPPPEIHKKPTIFLIQA